MTTIVEHNRHLRKAGLPSVEALATRILRVFDRATKSDVESGTRWYDDGAALCRQWSLETDWSLEHCAAVLSHLSPKTSWTRNVVGAAALLCEGIREVGIMERNFNKALDSLDYDEPELSFGPTAPKTLRFYRNFLGDREAVTVDVWACRVARIDETLLSRKGVYDALEAAYRRAARQRGVEPATMQATTWILARGGRVG